ncbi:MAG TPA: PQQ-binding-like beta-propeller repeat protein [Phycisphaerae bacterium]|nr:PQQ-binding-like beta-propeller repeat protein [Phycisphaerae bacterium]HOJ72542.1 PQQ-binding-like beta-propeller repeat protein [Phycisphaerae bacterium]HOM49797.1 PQQ-binding-like beta-propeller repeat protein [Phycisphaerae bacterium]HON68185.1 PQQ-binding-like beta-propeller repeat protein [Phycisphaerae bacterium]HOQ84243.1 PQQ-binding-like beta-propeller repeat protein [Phycisphaerae bacterium]
MTEYASAVLHPSEEATTLLNRALDGAARQDWKLVVDSLQRIIELPGDHILATDASKYESARQHAQRQLGALPPEGLRAYRLIFDGQAAAIFNRAVEEHDESALRGLIDRSLLTSHGDDAAVVLADWMIDEGRFLEAAILLRLVRDVYPDSDLPSWAIPVRLAVCMAGMQRPDQAAALLDSLEPKSGETAPELAARIAQVREYLGRAAVEEPPLVEQGWPMAYGRSSRNGSMSPVEPTFVNHLPWNVALPVPTPKGGIGAIQEAAAAQQLMPAAEITTDGRVIVVKSGVNLLGLDRDTFEPLWSTQSEEEQADLVDLGPAEPQGEWTPWPGAERASDDRTALNPHIRRLYYDSVGNQLCLAAGLAVTVEWPGEPPNTLAARRDRIIRRHAMQMAGTAQSHPNFVVAYSMLDGRRVWTSDTTSGPQALGPVEFLAAPIVVDNLLLAPGRVNDDLYAVLLDPRTGRIERHIYLCGTGGAPFDSLYACTPAAADGIVFIPTGRGVLVAIDTAGWSIRWAVRYDGVAAPANELAWLPTPVIAVSDVIILAPPDVNVLFCYERATGTLRWHVSRENARYVLAAGDGLVWTVGEDVMAYELDSGKRAWTTHCGVPAGRGARAGDRLYLPTISGLAVLDARTGRRVEQRDIDIPPGNLLAYEDSLYVASAFEIRKYPDMKRGYDQAVLAHQRNPADISLAMRLGWLEHLRGEPARALQALAQVPEWTRAQDEKRYSRLLHLKLLATLELASAPDTPPETARQLLNEAQQLAQNAEDAIMARLALGEFHERSASATGLLDACREYATLALEPTGDEIISGQDDSYELKAGLMAGRRLADLLPRLSAEQTDTFMGEMQQVLAQAIRTRNVGQLRRLSNCSALQRLAVQADLALAIWAAKDLAYEQAEAYLKRVIDRAESPELLAEAVGRLSVIHLQPGELHLPVSGAELARRLSTEFADVQIPADILETEWAPPALPGQAAQKRMTGEKAARLLHKRVDDKILATHEAALAPAVLGSPAKPPEATAYAGARPLVIRGPRSEAMSDRMLLFLEDRTVEARQVEDGELLWPAELRLLGEMQVESRTLTDGQRFMPRLNPSEPARGLAAGQTLIVNTRFGIHAVGLLTGRRLWSRRFDPPVTAGQNAAGSDSCIWAHDGYVISIDQFGRLEVARCESGTDVLWRRRMLERRWQTVRAFGDYLVVGDAVLEKVDVFRIADGTHLGLCEFRQPGGSSDRAVNIAIVADAICGPISPHEVAAIELKTPGVEPRWTVRMEAELSQIFKPSDDTLAVADRQGNLKLVDPATGKVTLDVNVPACAQGVIDGRLESGVLYVYGFEKRTESNRLPSDRQQWSLAAIRVPNGDVLWARTGLGPLMCVTGDALTASTNAIPVLAYRPAIAEGTVHHGNTPLNAGTGRRAKMEFMVVDKATGATIGDTVSINVDGVEGSSMLLDLQVWPNRVTAFYGGNYLRFSLLPPGERPSASSGPQTVPPTGS